MQLETIIGLEIHVQLRLNSKLFSTSNLDEASPSNTNLNLIDLGHPGTLPRINESAVKTAAKLGFVLNMKVHEFSKFDRKHYFYPDLPKGYQITQFDEPIATEGHLKIVIDGEDCRFDIERMHMEEDAAKSFHLQIAGEQKTAVDYNRAGACLCEIVTHPCFRTPRHAKLFLEELQRYCRYVGASDADMEKGQLRVDANISLRPLGEKKLYPKTEIKNLNSFKNVEKALLYEQELQSSMWKEGNIPNVNKTVGWRDEEGKTILQRTKETSADYRYFPEPDVAPVQLTTEVLEQWKSELPEMPYEKRIRFESEYSLNSESIKQLVDNKDISEFFEEIVSATLESLSEIESDDNKTKTVAKLTYNWLITEYVKNCNLKNLNIIDRPLSSTKFAEFLAQIARKTMNSSSAQKALSLMFETGKDIEAILSEYDLKLSTQDLNLEEIVANIIKNNPKEAEAYKAGKTALLQFFVGQAMKETKGKAEPTELSETLKKLLS